MRPSGKSSSDSLQQTSESCLSTDSRRQSLGNPCLQFLMPKRELVSDGLHASLTLCAESHADHSVRNKGLLAKMMCDAYEGFRPQQKCSCDERP
eukprot:2794117-Amphidinium_carterae.1